MQYKIILANGSYFMGTCFLSLKLFEHITDCFKCNSPCFDHTVQYCLLVTEPTSFTQNIFCFMQDEFLVIFFCFVFCFSATH